MFVVAGVTGNTGKIVAASLAAAGKEVRALVRSESAAAKVQALGYEPFHAPLEDAEKLASGLAGAEGAYLLIPPFFGPGILQHNENVSGSIARALEQAAVPQVVLLSSIAAQNESGTGPIMSVRHLEQATSHLTGVTYLRAAFFQENWLAVLGAAKDEKILPSFLPLGQKTSMVASYDIGTEAANILLGKSKPARVVQLAGPLDYTPEDVAEGFAEALSHPVQAVGLPTSQVVDTFVSFGLPAELAALYQEMYEAAHKKELEFDPSVEVRRGKTGIYSLVSEKMAGTQS